MFRSRRAPLTEIAVEEVEELGCLADFQGAAEDNDIARTESGESKWSAEVGCLKVRPVSIAGQLRGEALPACVTAV